MQRYILRRLLQSVLLLFLLSIGLFALIHLLGSPADLLVGRFDTPQARAALAAKYGLDKSLPEQYIAWITTLLHGDLGRSFASHELVAVEMGLRLPATLELIGTAITIALVVATLLGVVAAVRQYSVTDYTATFVAYFGISMPVFWFAFILQQIFGVLLRILPVFGIAGDNVGTNPADIFADRILHLILPASVLSLAYIAGWSRYLRSSMLDTVKQDYIRTARSKGLSPRLIFFRHALRNALIPFVTVIALTLPDLVGGATITETIFAWPGLGRLFFDSLTARDFPILLATMLLSSVAVILFNLLADLLYGVLDPRIRYS